MGVIGILVMAAIVYLLPCVDKKDAVAIPLQRNGLERLNIQKKLVEQSGDRIH